MADRRHSSEEEEDCGDIGDDDQPAVQTVPMVEKVVKNPRTGARAKMSASMALTKQSSAEAYSAKHNRKQRMQTDGDNSSFDPSPMFKLAKPPQRRTMNNFAQYEHSVHEPNEEFVESNTIISKEESLIGSGLQNAANRLKQS